MDESSECNQPRAKKSRTIHVLMKRCLCPVWWVRRKGKNYVAGSLACCTLKNVRYWNRLSYSRFILRCSLQISEFASFAALLWHVFSHIWINKVITSNIFFLLFHAKCAETVVTAYLYFVKYVWQVARRGSNYSSSYLTVSWIDYYAIK